MTYRWAADPRGVADVGRYSSASRTPFLCRRVRPQSAGELSGAITKVDWNTPHVYFYVDVKDDKTGRVANWSFEMGAPAVLTAQWLEAVVDEGRRRGEDRGHASPRRQQSRQRAHGNPGGHRPTPGCGIE